MGLPSLTREGRVAGASTTTPRLGVLTPSQLMDVLALMEQFIVMGVMSAYRLGTVAAAKATLLPIISNLFCENMYPQISR